MGAIDTFLDAVVRGDPTGAAFAADAEVDATVPQWRLRRRGREAIDAQFARWYADPGRFEELHRVPVPDGEAVEWMLVWQVDGVPYACHEIHVLELDDDGLIRSDRVWCGGRWPAKLLAEIEAANGG